MPGVWDDMEGNAFAEMAREGLAVITAMHQEMAKPENANAAARMCRSFFDALVREGFSPEEALAITVAKAQTSTTVTR
ncbi:hypothetical protein HYT95_03480 [Candidatus Peregrinibacteria bacterium]|nr:hypothetical protein [Candidatus Peregrinibacteria bacterium]